jgi:LEA14-like dessication related protein
LRALTPAAVFLSLSLLGCAGLAPNRVPIDVTLSSIAPAQIGLIEQQYRIELRIQNPNTFAVDIDGFAYEIELNGKPFAKGVSDQAVTVPRFGEIVLQTTAVSNLSGVMAQIGALRQGVADGLPYRVRGRIGAANGFAIPFDRRGQIGPLRDE